MRGTAALSRRPARSSSNCVRRGRWRQGEPHEKRDAEFSRRGAVLLRPRAFVSGRAQQDGAPTGSIQPGMNHRNYKWTVVGMLWFICFFNYADRQAIFSVFPKLKTEFGFDPVQLGLIGSAFAWVYA